MLGTDSPEVRLFSPQRNPLSITGRSALFSSVWKVFEKPSQCPCPCGNGWGLRCIYIPPTSVLSSLLYRYGFLKDFPINLLQANFSLRGYFLCQPNLWHFLWFFFLFQRSLFKKKISFHFLLSFGNWTPEKPSSTPPSPSVLANFIQPINEPDQFP